MFVCMVLYPCAYVIEVNSNLHNYTLKYTDTKMLAEGQEKKCEEMSLCWIMSSIRTSSRLPIAYQKTVI